MFEEIEIYRPSKQQETQHARPVSKGKGQH